MKFWKVFLASLLAIFVSSVISLLVWIGVISGAVAWILSSLNKPDFEVTSSTVLKIDMAENISDAPLASPLAGFDIKTMTYTPTLSLLEVLRTIEAAQDDDRIRGLYLNFSGPGNADMAVLEELRSAIESFKQSGKFVVAYNSAYTQGAYYVASAADKVYMQPEGELHWSGISSTQFFLKGTFDKLGVKAEVFRPTSCKYKSAVEPYFRSSMSEANRLQMKVLGDKMWEVIVGDVARSRNLDPTKLNALANHSALHLPAEALNSGLVDGLIYEDQLDAVFEEYGVSRRGDGLFNIITLGQYKTLIHPASGSKPKVGVVYANGEILDGKGEDDKVYSEVLAETLRKAREDGSIKAVVLRVNSPGGSALASDVIWREVELLKRKKPVVVSMGAYAASGGYYISAPADVIVADRLTLTGSIGVFGMMLDGSAMFKNKLGITFDGVKTNSSADFGQGFLGMTVRSITPREREAMIRSVDKVYDTFTRHVAEGRNLKQQRVLEIAEGRVWSGTQAVELGLADANGGLREAVAVAANKAELGSSYIVVEVLPKLSPLAELLKVANFSATSASAEDISNMLMIEERKKLLHELTRSGVQAYSTHRVTM